MFNNFIKVCIKPLKYEVSQIKETVFIDYAKKYDYKTVSSVIKKTLRGRKKRFKRVVIKPNLCYDRPLPGATTNAELVKNVTKFFSKRSKEVFVVESDASLYRAEEAFKNLRIDKAVKKGGGQLINLSKHAPYRYLKFLFPYDLFVNLPVLKTHEFTLVTGAVKNLFGMIPERKRIKYHPFLDQVLVDLCEIYKNQLIIVDAIRGMEGHGPTRGRIVDMNIIISGKNPAAVDRIMCKVMGFDISEIPHIEYACKKLNPDGVNIKCSGVKLDDVIKNFDRPHLDPITATKMWIWRHKRLNDIFFASPFYKVTRAIGLKLRKSTRAVMGLEKIDD